MITSFVQYTLLAPSYINILNVYAVSRMLPTQITTIIDLSNRVVRERPVSFVGDRKQNSNSSIFTQ